MFEEEKPFLMQLPPEPYELSQWKVATVGPNYHIAVDVPTFAQTQNRKNNHYSFYSSYNLGKHAIGGTFQIVQRS